MRIGATTPSTTARSSDSISQRTKSMRWKMTADDGAILVPCTQPESLVSVSHSIAVVGPDVDSRLELELPFESAAPETGISGKRTESVWASTSTPTALSTCARRILVVVSTPRHDTDNKRSTWSIKGFRKMDIHRSAGPVCRAPPELVCAGEVGAREPKSSLHACSH